MKATRKQIEDFISEKRFLFYGASSVKGKFGNLVLKHLNDNGYKVYPVHPDLSQVNGIDCYKKSSDAGEGINCAILILGAENTEKVTEELISYGIKKIWMQQRSGSEKSINDFKDKGIEVITDECILMFTDPITIVHRIHKWVNKVTGKLPA